MDRAQQWLHRRRRALQWATVDPGRGTQELLTKVPAGVGALEAAAALSAEEAAVWREQLRGAAAGCGDIPADGELPPGTRETAESLLRELLAQAVAEDDELGPAGQRFEGAIHLLGAAGIVDPAAWDERGRKVRGWASEQQERARERELNAGGTQVDLRRVYAGPDEDRGGRRLLYVLVFGDGVSCRVERKEPHMDLDGCPSWRLSDDHGTRYMPAGGSGGDSDETIDFRQAPPPSARWLQLALGDDPAVSFRVVL